MALFHVFQRWSACLGASECRSSWYTCLAPAWSRLFTRFYCECIACGWNAVAYFTRWLRCFANFSQGKSKWKCQSWRYCFQLAMDRPASHYFWLQRRKLKAVADLAANIEAGKGPVDCAGFITTLIWPLLTKQLFTALIEDSLQILFIVIGVSIVLI